MIVDHIKNHAKYMNLPPRIVHAIQYIGSTDFTFVESGQYELDGKKLVSMVQRYKTKLPEQAVWESHRKYIDVQFVAGGHEQFGHGHLGCLHVVLGFAHFAEHLLEDKREDALAAFGLQAIEFLVGQVGMNEVLR